MWIKIWKAFRAKQSAWLLLLFLLTLSLPASTTNSSQRVLPFKITAMKAMLFYEDKGTFSADVSEVDSGPPYVPPTQWNTPLHSVDRSTSVLVTVEVTGEGGLLPERQLEFKAQYIPWDRESRAIVVRKVVPLNIPHKTGEQDKYYAGFWLYQTGCNPVKLSARVIGPGQASPTKRVIKFGCGE